MVSRKYKIVKKKKIKKIIGSKIILEPFNLKFVSENYLSWMNDKETTKFIEKAKNDNSISDLNSFARKMINSKSDYFFAIILKKNLLHIGNVKLGPIDFELMKSNFGILIGHKDYRGRGIGTEVLNLIKKFSFNYLKLKQLKFLSVRNNYAATHLYEKTGFILNNDVNKTMFKDGKLLKLVEWTMNNSSKIK